MHTETHCGIRASYDTFCAKFEGKVLFLPLEGFTILESNSFTVSWVDIHGGKLLTRHSIHFDHEKVSDLSSEKAVSGIFPPPCLHRRSKSSVRYVRGFASVDRCEIENAS